MSQCTHVAVATHAQVKQINMQYSLAIKAFSVNISEHTSHERVRDGGTEGLNSEQLVTFLSALCDYHSKMFSKELQYEFVVLIVQIYSSHSMLGFTDVSSL